jgi:hypothetical protein
LDLSANNLDQLDVEKAMEKMIKDITSILSKEIINGLNGDDPSFDIVLLRYFLLLQSLLNR